MTVNVDPRGIPGLKEKIAYGCGDFSSNLLWGISGAFLLYYYTDVLGLAPSDIAILLLVTRVFDAFCDPTVGFIIDRSGGRLVRPLIKWLAVPFGCVAFLAFLPISDDSHANLAWAYVSYLLFGLIYSAINTPYGILQGVMTTDPQSRLSLGAFRMMGCQLGTLTVNAITLPAIHWLGGGTLRENEYVGFPIYMAMIGAIGAALWFVTYRVCKVRYQPQTPRHGVRELLKSLSRNRPWLVCTVSFGLSFVGLCAYLTFSIYYAKFILHKDAQFGGYLLLLFTVCSLVGNVTVTLPFFRRATKTRRLQSGYLLQAGALAVIGCFPGSMAVFLPCFTVACFASGFGSPLYYAMIADSIDYGARTTGVRTAGMGYSLNSWLQKVVFGLTGALLAGFLSFGDYAPAALQQNEHLADWITAGFIWLPAAVSLLLVPIISLYPSDESMSAHATEHPVLAL